MRISLILLVLIAVTAAPAAAQKPYGNGTPGTAGLVPTLDASQAWMGNLNFEWRIEDALGGAFAYLLVSAAPGSSFFNGTEILVDTSPGALLTIEPIQLRGPNGLPSFGTGSHPAPINLPPIPVLAGFSIYAQALILDFPTPGTLAATRGLESEFTLPPEIVVGANFQGGTYFTLDPQTATVTSSSAPGSDAENAIYVNSGRDLFLNTGSLVHANTDAGSAGATFTTVYTPPAMDVAELEFDEDLQIMYTLASPNGAFAREIIGIDVNPASALFGQIITQSSLSIANGAERWAMSPDGRFAVIGLFPDGMVVDTDPNSLTYMQQIAHLIFPDASFSLPVWVEITEDNQALITLYEFNLQSRVARYDLENLQWIDHNPNLPGIQNIGPNSFPFAPIGIQANMMAMSRDRRTAVVTGSGNYLGRIDITDNTTFGWSYTDLSSATHAFNGDAVGISPDGDRAAVVTPGSNTAGIPAELHLVDTSNGTVLQSHILSATSILPWSVAFR